MSLNPAAAVSDKRRFGKGIYTIQTTQYTHIEETDRDTQGDI